MRRKLPIFTFFVLLISFTVNSIYASDETIKVYINQEIVNFSDEEPYIDQSGRTQVPIRFIGEMLGAKIEWNSKEKIDKMSDEIVSKLLKPEMTDYEKVLAVNNYVIDNVETDISYPDAWDAFLYGKAQSIGYSNMVGLLLEKTGVESLDL